MDERKKDAIYELGCYYESMNKGEQAMEEFKLVYSADISFRDVAEKINAFAISKPNGERAGFEPGTAQFDLSWHIRPLCHLSNKGFRAIDSATCDII